MINLRMARSHALIPALVLLIGSLLTTAAVAQSQPRIALIITNQEYRRDELKLQNPHADGDSSKAALETVDFDVTVVRDTAHRGELEDAVGKYVARLADAGPDAVGFFYYSGHGAAGGPQGHNYLLPTDANITHAAQLRLSALSVEAIVNALSQAGGKMSFVVFDACRNVPLLRSDKSNYKGFAPYRDAPGMLIAYATEAGDVAADESFYSRALAEEIVKPDREAGSVFRAVSRRVFQATGGGQRPVPIDKRFDDFYFKPAVGIVNTQPPMPSCDGVEVGLGTGGTQCVKPGSGAGFKDCPECPEMMVVPKGEFKMGSPDNEAGRDSDEGPLHPVDIPEPFAIGRYEITVGKYRQCVRDGGCLAPEWQETGSQYNIETGSDDHYKKLGAAITGDRYPIVGVSWNNAKSFTVWLSKRTGITYRLLSEAEWEYAARAGTQTRFSFGDSEANLGDYAW